MKTVELHIAQVEAEPDRLYWTFYSDGIKTSGVFELSTPDDVARFTACAAHVFNHIKTFKSDSVEQPRTCAQCGEPVIIWDAHACPVET